MIEVKLLYYSPTSVMDIVRDLRSKGLVQGKDFDFAYSHATFDPVSGHQIEGRNTVFTFYEEKWATWLALRYPKEASNQSLI